MKPEGSRHLPQSRQPRRVAEADMVDALIDEVQRLVSDECSVASGQ